MFRINKVLGKKGIALPLVLLIAVVLLPLGMGSVYLLRQETKMTVKGKASLQADQLAEGAANRGLAELQKRIYTDLNINLFLNSYSDEAMQDFVDNPMDFAHACLWDTGVHFSTAPGVNAATLTFVEELETGRYTAAVVISTTQVANWDPDGGGSGDPIATFFFKYRILAQATSRYGVESSNIVMDSASPSAARANGEFEIQLRRANFAHWLDLLNSWGTGYATSAGYYDGPVHCNGIMSFCQFPTFTELVTSSWDTARFWNNGTPVELNNDHNGAIDVPDFQGGFIRGANQIDLPEGNDMVTQQRAALGFAPTASTDSICGLAPGVYFDHDSNGDSSNNGIYIKGSVDSLTLSTAGGGNEAVYTIVQGAVTTTIQVHMTGNWTKKDGGAAITGTPNGVIFVEGAINSLNGVVQQDSQVTIAAAGNIGISGADFNDPVFGATTLRGLIYSEDPRSVANATNVLGVISWNNNVELPNNSNKDITIHASVMAPNGQPLHQPTWDSSPTGGTLHLLGGSIGDTAGYKGQFGEDGSLSHGYMANFIYDRRFLAGLYPPYFPTTGLFVVDDISDFNQAPSWRRQARGL